MFPSMVLREPKFFNAIEINKIYTDNEEEEFERLASLANMLRRKQDA